MQLPEAVVISFINTTIIAALFVFRNGYRQGAKVCRSFACKLDEDGALREIFPDSVPVRVMEVIRERMKREVKLFESIMPGRPAIVFFVLVIFFVQLIALLAV